MKPSLVDEVEVEVLEQAHECLEMKRKEYKELRKELKALKQSFDELNASHESLKEDHEELGKAHTKLEKAHSSLLDQGKKEVVLTCDVGSTCDLINESFLNLSLWLLLTPLVALPLLLHL